MLLASIMPKIMPAQFAKTYTPSRAVMRAVQGGGGVGQEIIAESAV